jgi:hypothetical protein
MPDRPADLDEEAVLDELYGLRPDRFTTARTQYAAHARQAGDRALAGRITALRRPTLAAWASNQLVRSHPEQVEPILRLGESLRRAHRDLDGRQLRELTGRQRALVHALTAQARQLAATAGQPLQESAVHEVEQTLHAALADPDAARRWAGGRLTRALSTTVDLTGAASEIAPPDRQTLPAHGRPADTKTAADDEDRRLREQQQERIARARRQAAEDAQEAAASEDAVTAAREVLDAAATAVPRAEDDVERLTGELREAETARHAAQQAQGEAEHRVQDAETAAQRARQRAADSAARVEDASP